ncbi:MAG: LysE family translocator [Minwuia sp.]|uniref:LysE family translocator n=1 Tax=Minwuia sp. TaxID=2493630 RepID=UPI003A87A991
MSDTFISLLIFAAVATLTPGGATTLATASGVQFGYWRSLPLLAGNAGGLAILCATAGAGLGALLLAVPELTLAMRVAGSAYLLWLAWRIGSAGPPSSGGRTEPMGVLTGLLLLVVNPKAWTMALGGAASFATLAASPAELALILGGVFGLSGITALSLWCAGGTLLGKVIRSDRQWRAANVTLGLLLALSVVPIWMG